MSFRSIWDIDDVAESESDPQRTHLIEKSSVSSSPIKLHTNIIKGCKAALFPKPNKVQLEVLPHFTEFSCENLVICAPPHSGKTSSVVLAILDSFSKASAKYSLAVLLGPTYEIAEASYSCAQQLATFCDVSLYFTAKGKRITRDNKNPKEIFIGTPEKILELSRSSVINLKKISFLLVDEADCLRNPKKYFSDVSQIHQKLTRCRIIICTASMNDAITDFVNKRLVSYETVTVENDVGRKFPIQQIYLVYESDEEKIDSLAYLIGMERFRGQVVIFCETKDSATELGELLHDRAILSVVLIGDLSVLQRKNILEEFRDEIIPVLITTRSFVSVIPVAGSTKLIHYDQILNEKHALDTDTYKKRECLLTIAKKCLEVYFVEKKWADFLFREKETINERIMFKDIDIVSSDKLETFFQ